MSLREPENVLSVPTNGQKLTFTSTKLFLENVAPCSVNMVMPTLNGHHVHFWTINTQSGHGSRCLQASHGLRAARTITQGVFVTYLELCLALQKACKLMTSSYNKTPQRGTKKNVVEPSALRTAALERYGEWGAASSQLSFLWLWEHLL